MLIRRRARGQALFETAVFLPLMLFAIFGVMYVSRGSVLAEREQTAIRYGSFVVYPEREYTLESMYYWYITQYDATVTDPACDSVKPALASALTQQQEPAAGPSAPAVPLPSAPPYFQPLGTPTTSCSAAVIVLHPGGNPDMAFEFAGAVSEQLSATTNSPNYIKRIISSSLSPSASLAVLTPAGPALILQCRPKVAGPLSLVLTATGTGYGGYQQHGNPHNC